MEPFLVREMPSVQQILDDLGNEHQHSHSHRWIRLWVDEPVDEVGKSVLTQAKLHLKITKLNLEWVPSGDGFNEIPVGSLTGETPDGWTVTVTVEKTERGKLQTTYTRSRRTHT